MASVSWFDLFNIQVRANCTTACDTQAARQEVERTQETSSASFFFFCFVLQKKEKVHAAWNRFQKSCLAPPPSPPRWWEESARSNIGPVCPGGSDPIGRRRGREQKSRAARGSYFSVCSNNFIKKQRCHRCFFFFFYPLSLK